MQLMVNKELTGARTASPQDGFGGWIGVTCDFLCDLSRRLDGDTQKALILIVLAHARTRPGGGPIRAAHLAARTGIPRETVRRKLAAMADSRLIERDARRRWLMSTSDEAAALGLPG